MKIRAKICKTILLLVIVAFLFSFISCKDTGAQTEIKELKAEIEKLKEPQGQDEQKPESTEEVKEEVSEEKTVTEEVKKEFSPTIVGSLYTQGYSISTFILDDYLYTGGQGLNIINITDKSNPKLVSTISDDWITKIYIDGNYAFVAYSRWDNETNISKGGFKVMDISNKEAPTEVGNFNMDGDIFDMAVLGNYVFISYAIYGQQEMKSGVEIVDTTDKTNPISAGNLACGTLGGGPFCISGKTGYLFAGNTLKIIDLEDIANITEIGSHSLSIYANELRVDDNYIYFTMSNTLQIIDISDENNLEIIGGVFGRGNTQGIAIEDDYACISYTIHDSSNNNWIIKESGLQIIDLDNKNQASIVARINIPGEASGISIKDNYAYVAAGPIGIHIIKLFN